MSLVKYNRKRKFDQTPEPKGDPMLGTGPLRFVIQMHSASRLHFDFRLEAAGVLKSWAVPKGPSMNAQDQRLAVQVEDHPINYGDFEGIIPKGNYGAGTVLIWDEGTFHERNSQSREESEQAILKGIDEGHLTFILEGHKLRGEFALIHLKKGRAEGSNRSHPKAEAHAWLLIKKRDEFSSYKIQKDNDRSVKTGRTLQEISKQAQTNGEVWLPARTQASPSPTRPAARSAPSAGPSGAPSGAPSAASATAFSASSPSPSQPALPPPPAAAKMPPRVPIKKEAFPRRTKPMLPVMRATPFDQEGWIFEADHEGFRTLAEVEEGRVHLYSKQLLPFNAKFPQVVLALHETKITALLDGEVVVDKNGVATYWLRDLLHLKGQAIHHLPLIERKKLLEKLPIFNSTLCYCPHQIKKGHAFFEQAKKAGIPAILARSVAEPYHAGVHPAWLKIPVQQASLKTDAPRLTHLEKIYWPQERITKGDLIEYYRKVSSALLPHLKDRPQSMHRFPDGIGSPGFFHKDLVGHHPKWVHTLPIQSHSTKKSVNYLLCQNEPTLLYMINLGCIELNPWLSRVGALEHPDFVVIDLDPDGNPFSEVVEIALAIHEVLEKIGAFHLCKTSGGTGLHLFIPVAQEYSYEEGREFALEVCGLIHKSYPKLTSLERSPAKRKGKIYLDCFQNAQGQTVASVYCVRPQNGAPVSTPLQWKELTSKLTPSLFNIHTFPKRLVSLGDLWAPMLDQKVDLKTCLARLENLFSRPLKPRK